MLFDGGDLLRVSGLPGATINRWVHRGVLAMEAGDRRPGRGKRNRRYSWSTALGVSLAGALVRAGVELPIAERVIKWCQSGHLHTGVMNGHHYLVATRKQLFLARDGAIFAGPTGRDVAVVAIDLPQAIRTFQRAIEGETAAVAASN